jgi:membrane-bound serine protease (ClpP class)
VPVCVYVAPSGAHAASAGTYLTYAAHIAAMAPGTNIGAASPISMMQPPAAKDFNTTAFSTAEQKARNDAKAYIKSLAQLRDRNITWAIHSVEKAESLSAEDALRMGVIDLMADDTRQLLEKIDGMTVKVNGIETTLDTASAGLVMFEADWKTELLGIITDPNIAYILLLVAIYGIFFELMNPGAFVPGVIGVISGILALYALNLLPFNYAGLLLMILGIAFMIAEVFIAGFGILGIGGVVAFAAGSLLLFDAQTLGSGVSVPLVIAFSLVSIGFFILIFGYLWRSRSRKVLGGSEEMIGAEAEVLDAYGQEYRVRCHGEIWRAVSDEPLQAGDTVHVVSIDNLILSVTKE